MTQLPSFRWQGVRVISRTGEEHVSETCAERPERSDQREPKECSLNSQHQRPQVKQQVSETPFSHLQNEDRTRSRKGRDVTHKACPFGSASGSASGQILGVCVYPMTPDTRPGPGDRGQRLCVVSAHPQAEQCSELRAPARTFSDGEGGRKSAAIILTVGISLNCGVSSCAKNIINKADL